MGVFLNLFMWQMRYLETLLKSGKTVFTYEMLGFFLQIANRDTLKSLIQRLVKSWVLQRLHHGIYALPHYEIFEFATLLQKRSYISLETVLKKEAIIFQDYGTRIFLMWEKTEEKTALGRQFECHKIKDGILYNPIGVIQTGSYAIATAERAVCDRLYLSPNYYFDNLEPLNLEKLLEIAENYSSRVFLSVKKLLTHAR